MKVAFIFLLLLLFFPISVQAAHVMFEHRDRTYLSRDVFFERIRQVTTAGFLDLHILSIPLNDPYITIAPVESQRELGLRETTQALLAGAGAIAGTNADFFGMGGTHSLSFGPVISNGQLISVSAEYNHGFNEFAAFFLDESNIPMLRYVTPRIWFTVNGMELTQIASVNKIPNVERVHIINRNGMLHTSQLSARFPSLRKVVVDNGIVIAVSAHPVSVPEDGFVVVMSEYNFYRYRPDTWIGLPANYEIFINMERELSQIQTAVGGGGLILQGGVIVNDTGTAISGRHPRTALGITPDWQRLILMTVDGRGHSIGATHEEMAALLLRQGVTEAMHLDGGGSTTMVAQAGGRNTPLQVVNRVSDGAQRQVVNAMGVFDHSSPGAITELVLLPVDRYVSRGGALHLHVYGRDLYRHRLGLHPEGLHLSAYIMDAGGQMVPATGTWHNNTYIPDRPGPLYIRAQYGGMSVSRMYLVQDIVALRFATGPIFTTVEMAVPFAITGTTAAGTVAALSPDRGYVQFTVNPPDLGFVLDHVFIPSGSGVGYISAFMGGAVAHLPVAVSTHYNPIDHGQFMYYAAQFPVPPAFVDPIRTEMTAVIPGNAFDFSMSLPGFGSLAYSIRQEGPAAVLQMSAANGGIFASDHSQWGRFLTEINMMFPDFVIIRMDVNPLRGLSRDEFDLFHLALRTQQEMGRTVFVISNTEQSESLSLRNGIRYIDLGNAGYESSIYFRVIDRQIWYDF